MPLTEAVSPETGETAAPVAADRSEYMRFYWFIGACWFNSNVAYAIYDLPLRFLIKDQLGASAAAQATFLAVGRISNYVKPMAGVFTDAVPLMGTRRRHYLLFSLSVCGLGWLVFGAVPRTYWVLLATYFLLYIAIVFVSTTLGGVMAEGGERFRATGRLSAQRVALFRIGALIGGPAAGWLAMREWGLTTALVAALHFALVPLVYVCLRESPLPRGARSLAGAEVAAAWQQVIALIRCKPLWSAAGLVALIMAAPGFTTPLLYYQTDVLHFDKQFVGTLKMLEGAGGIAAAIIYGRLCGRLGLRPLLYAGILLHVIGALLFLGYRSPALAAVITTVYWLLQTLAILPLYDLAMRATPKGSEAMGYAVMMSVWNLTFALSDIFGSWLFKPLGFSWLIVSNAATTAFALLAVPFLPRMLTDRKDS